MAAESLSRSLLRSLREAAHHRELQLDRLRARGAEPAPDDLYALPLPVSGPLEWLVLALESGSCAWLSPLDRRLFGDKTDLWLAEGEWDFCLRLAATAHVHTASLEQSARFGVLPGAAKCALTQLLEDAPDAVMLPARSTAQPTTRSNDLDETESEWRGQLQRASRLLPRWLDENVLALRFSDLRHDFSGLATDLLAAAPQAILAPLRRAPAAVEHGVLCEEIECEGGRLLLVASSLGLGFLYEPEQGAPPPPVLWITQDGDRPGEWHALGKTYRAFLAHDWLHGGPGRASLSLRQHFRIEIYPDQLWS